MPNSVDDVLAGAKKTLSDANNLTTTAEGTSTSAFAPKDIPSHITGVPAHQYSAAPYSGASELKAKADNVKQYKAATE